jgi:hypothetical protein
VTERWLAAKAGFGATVSDLGELPQALKDALAAVHGGRSTVVSVQLRNPAKSYSCGLK